jgi:2-dehydro-3-deoxygluconokinase
VPTPARAPSLVAFGELMLRLDPVDGLRLVQADRFAAHFTGAEANVAASLAGWGIPSSLVSAVPDHAIGRACIGYLRRFGVETGNIIHRPSRLGVIFVDPGGAGRSTQVIYDRAASVFATCDPDAYDWPTALAGFGWLHVSGTVAATGGAAAEALQRGDCTRPANSVSR